MGPKSGVVCELGAALAAADGAPPSPIRLSPIGERIQAALENGPAETIPHQFSLTLGRIERLVINNIDPHDEGCAELAQAIRTAHNEVCAQFYIFDSKSDAAHAILGALAENQRRNPDLRLFLAINTVLSQADQAEAELRRFGLRADISVHAVLPTRGSLHSKVVILDGAQAYVGGNNVDNPAEADATAILRGSVVDNLLSEFDEAFLAGDIRSTGKVFHPADLMRSHSNNPPNIDRAESHCLIHIVGKAANRSLTPRLDAGSNRAFLEAIDAAQRVVKIMTPNFNELLVWDRLVRAANRGVTIHLLVPRDHLNLPSFVDIAPNRSLGILLDRLTPAERRRIDVRWFSEPDGTPADNHAKIVIVDDAWVYIGSQNMDRQSWGYSRELGIGVDDAATARAVSAEVFDEAWADGRSVRPGVLSHLLLRPTHNLLHRCGRYLFPPLAIAERVFDEVRRWRREN